MRYHEGVIAKLQADRNSNQALLRINTGTADAVVLDRGASGHYLKHEEYFTSFIASNLSACSANGIAIPLLGSGQAVIHASTGPIILEEEFFTPELSNSLISLTLFVKQGYAINPTINGDFFAFQKGNNLLCVGSTEDNVLLI